MGLLEYVEYIVQSAMVINPKILRVLKVFRAVRALRALRVLRTISFLKNLQVIVATLLSSIPAMGSIILLLFLVLCALPLSLAQSLTRPPPIVLTALPHAIDVYAIMGVYIFGPILPAKFGTIFGAVFTLFQLITLDDWFMVYNEIWEADGAADNPHMAFWYFFSYIVSENFIFVNLFTAVIVSNLERRNYNVSSADTDGAAQANASLTDDAATGKSSNTNAPAPQMGIADVAKRALRQRRVGALHGAEREPLSNVQRLLVELELRGDEYNNCKERLQSMAALGLLQQHVTT